MRANSLPPVVLRNRVDIEDPPVIYLLDTGPGRRSRLAGGVDRTAARHAPDLSEHNIRSVV